MNDKIPLDHKYNACLAPTRPWASRLSFVAGEARAVLLTFGTQRVVSTKDLIELLYPENLARGTESHLARKSIGRLLRTLATGALADCARRGETAKVRGKVVQLWRWGCPQTADGLPVYNDDYRPGTPREIAPDYADLVAAVDGLLDAWATEANLSAAIQALGDARRLI